MEHIEDTIESNLEVEHIRLDSQYQKGKRYIVTFFFRQALYFLHMDLPNAPQWLTILHKSLETKKPVNVHFNLVGQKITHVEWAK
ncbi:MAG: hypothetical protein JW841_08530 [Deltaproteobacteria bacterium]|nr:hypothetical protein [Deltaproteobacteria bacterium]